jgi:hypothetical protein
VAIGADVIARYGGRPWRIGGSDYLSALLADLAKRSLGSSVD